MDKELLKMYATKFYLKKKLQISIVFLVLTFFLLHIFSAKIKIEPDSNLNDSNSRFSKKENQIRQLTSLNISIWTFLTDYKGYLDSAIKLIKSIKNNTRYNLTNFFIMDLQEKPLPAEIRKKLEGVGWRIRTVKRIPPRDEGGTYPRFRDQFTKFELWNIDEYEANIYFDSDTFVIGNIDEFLNLYKKFKYPEHKIGVTRDIRAGQWQTTFNMGVFIIKPNRTEYNYLLGLKNDSNFKFETTMSEQGFLNEAYKNQWYEIGFENNANLAVYSQKPDYWSVRSSNITVIHYTMEKPWSCGGVYKKVCALWENFS